MGREVLGTSPAASAAPSLCIVTAKVRAGRGASAFSAASEKSLGELTHNMLTGAAVEASPHQVTACAP